MINRYDFLNIAFYFLFIVGVGIYFSRRNKNTSDYFRGGGVLPWWVTGASAWMAGFTAWTFVGAAGQVYKTGPYVFVLYYQNLIPVIVLWAFTCYRFRRLRVVTPMEALRMRFGPGAQQFYTWMRLPIVLILGASALNAVANFMAPIFGVAVSDLMIPLGLMVTVISLLGGAMGVAASDFVQMFLIVLVATTTAVLALLHPGIGGISGLIAQAPAQHFEWGKIARPEFIGLWWVALTLNTLFGENSLAHEKSAKYMMAQSDSHARKTLIIPFLGLLFGPLLWIIPPMAAAVLHPDMAAHYPNLPAPQEAAFLAIARDVLPAGMLGLLISCIFAASVTDLGGNLNWGSGLLLRNFYLPVINPTCPEKRLMWLSRAAAVLLGLVLIGLALWINEVRIAAAATGNNISLFFLMNQLGTSLGIPLVLPACLGLFYARTPRWSAWTTAMIGFAIALAVSPRPLESVATWITGTPHHFAFITPSALSWIPGFAAPYSSAEVEQFGQIATALLVSIVCVTWFFFTSFFYEKSTPAYKASVEEFFRRARTPLLDNPDAGHAENRKYPVAIGQMCMIYGLFIALFVLIPNSLAGRLCYLLCGGVMAAVGFFLWKHYRAAAPAAGTASSGPEPADASAEAKAS